MKSINSEFAIQVAHITGLVKQPIHYLRDADKLSIRSAYSFYAFIHFIFIGLDYWQQSFIISNFIHFLQENSIAVTYTPLIEHYLSNKIFFTCLLISVNLACLPIIIAMSSYLYNLTSDISFKKIYTQNLLVAAFIPILFLNKYILSTIGIFSLIFSLIVFIANDKNEKMLAAFIAQNSLHLLLVFSPLILALFLS